MSFSRVESYVRTSECLVEPMDIIKVLSEPSRSPISCIEMHTTGEPTRIVIHGYPSLTGTLLEQRAQAKRKYDHIRRRLILEPRGHYDMYGAILRHETELTSTGEAHMGVLFLTNDGYSTMCGHATIALGRFLLDTHDLSVFPQRHAVKHDRASQTAIVNLHAPCGLIEITVPTTADRSKSDPTRPVSFVSVPSFATGVRIEIPIPENRRWPELGSSKSMIADFCYGGAFYCVVLAIELGFPNGLVKADQEAMNYATKQLKAAIIENPDLRYLFSHPDHEDLSFLYSIMVADRFLGKEMGDSVGAETGLCFFADQSIDRSPTGSAVAARAALSYARGSVTMNQTRTYHSLVSNTWNGQGAFTGTVVEEIEKHNSFPVVRVKVAGYASYTGFSTFVVEENDPLGDDGFVFQKLNVILDERRY